LVQLLDKMRTRFKVDTLVPAPGGLLQWQQNSVFTTFSPLLPTLPLAHHPAPTLCAIALKSPVERRISSLPSSPALNGIVAHALGLHGGVAEQQLVFRTSFPTHALALNIGGNYQLPPIAGSLCQGEVTGTIQVQSSSLKASEFLLTECSVGQNKNPQSPMKHARADTVTLYRLPTTN